MVPLCGGYEVDLEKSSSHDVPRLAINNTKIKSAKCYHGRWKKIIIYDIVVKHLHKIDTIVVVIEGCVKHTEFTSLISISQKFLISPHYLFFTRLTLIAKCARCRMCNTAKLAKFDGKEVGDWKSELADADRDGCYNNIGSTPTLVT